MEMPHENRGAGRLGHDANLDAVARALGAVPQTIAELAVESELHPRTVRRVLDALPELGVDVRRGQATAGEGRGRPAHTSYVKKNVGKLATRFEDATHREPRARSDTYGAHTRQALKKGRGQQQPAVACARKFAAVVELLDLGELVEKRRALERDGRRRSRGVPLAPTCVRGAARLSRCIRACALTTANPSAEHVTM